MCVTVCLWLGECVRMCAYVNVCVCVRMFTYVYVTEIIRSMCTYMSHVCAGVRACARVLVCVHVCVHVGVCIV